MRGLTLGAGPLHVACLAAHPDDVEIACGGLLLALARRGASGAWLTLTGTGARRVEAQKAAASFLPGAATFFAGLPDGRLPGHWLDVKDAMHEFAATTPAPDVILAPHPADAHQDHRLIAKLAPTVWRDALVLHYEIPKWDGDLTRPTTYVPVSDGDAARKVDLLIDLYPSQAAHDWWDRETFTSLMRLRGVECRARYAEAFTVTKAVLDLGDPL